MPCYIYNPLRAALLSITLLLTLHNAQAQTKIGGVAGPGDASAVLELQSSSQGFLHPRMTTTQRNSISNPATGLTIYNTTTNCLQVYKGAANGGWQDLCNTVGGAFSFTNCSSPVITGTFTAQTPTTATIQLSYTNSTGQTIGAFSSSTVNGITLSSSGGAATEITAGTGSITLTASGTPAAAGNFNIPVVLAGAGCGIPITVDAFQGNVPVACGTAPGCTGGVAPDNAVAGDKICWGGFEYFVVSANSRLWFDRNLGARRVATSTTDVQSYGDLYQWGRKGDGHQCTIYSNGGSSNGGTNPNSSTTATQATNSNPAHGLFITNSSDWITPQDANLWQTSASGGVNNPCPVGWRVPSQTEMSASNAALAPLTISFAGYRNNNGSLTADVHAWALHWTSTAFTSTQHTFVQRNASSANSGGSNRAQALSVRCIKN